MDDKSPSDEREHKDEDEDEEDSEKIVFEGQKAALGEGEEDDEE